MTRQWHALMVRVPLREDPAAAIRKLQRLQNWFASNHRPYALFRPDGKPRSEVVCLAVPSEEAGTALSFRSLCQELDLGGSIVQWRVASSGMKNRRNLTIQ